MHQRLSLYKLVKSEIYTNCGFKLVLCGLKIFICGNSKSFMVLCGSVTDIFEIFNSYVSFRQIESLKNEKERNC